VLFVVRLGFLLLSRAEGGAFVGEGEGWGEGALERELREA
jgi:hypothetical protein